MAKPVDDGAAVQAHINGGANAATATDRSLAADIIIANAPDPVFVSDLEGKILQANDAVVQLLGLPAGRGDRAVAVAVHQPGGDARVHRRPARGGGEGRRPATPG